MVGTKMKQAGRFLEAVVLGLMRGGACGFLVVSSLEAYYWPTRLRGDLMLTVFLCGPGFFSAWRLLSEFKWAGRAERVRLVLRRVVQVPVLAYSAATILILILVLLLKLEVATGHVRRDREPVRYEVHFR
jgi:hypothetical protein